MNIYSRLVTETDDEEEDDDEDEADDEETEGTSEKWTSTFYLMGKKGNHPRERRTERG